MSTNSTIDQNNLKSGNANPFFEESKLYMGFPQFDLIKNEHYMPAFSKGMSEHLNQINIIIDNDQKPTFENTIVALELAGQLLDRVATVFFALSSANTNDEMEEIRANIAPMLSAHSYKILLNNMLFKKIEELYNNCLLYTSPSPRD